MPRNPGEPKGRWIPWVRWFLLLVSLPVALYEASLVSEPGPRTALLLVALLSLLVSLWLHKPVQQRFEVDIDGRPARIELECSLSGAVRMRWSAGPEGGMTTLGRYWGVPQWFEPRITVAGMSRRMLVHLNRHGFIISNGSEPYAFNIRENEMHFQCVGGSTPMTRVLFICTQNRLRSPTAEHLFAGRSGYEVASAGVDAYATTPVSAALLEWADVIFVMEQGHHSEISRRFDASLKGKQVVCLDIPDMFHYMEPALVRLLEARAGPYFK